MTTSFFLSFFLFWSCFGLCFSGWESNDHFWMIYDSIYALDSGNGTATTCHPSRDLTGANGSGHHRRHSMDSGGQNVGHCDMRTETLRGTRWRGSRREIYGLFFSFERGERERRTGTGRRLLVNMQTVEGYPRVVGKRVSKSKFIFFPV
jgi:hypothetical protein